MAAKSHDEDFAADPVPDDRRIAWPLVFFAEMGVATALFFMQLTSILTLAYGSTVTLITIAYSTIVAAAIGFAICRVSIRTGFGMNLIARRLLGYRGAVLFSLIFGVNELVYFAAEAGIMGSSFKQLVPGVPLWLVLPASALAMVPLVWFGMRLLARLQLITFGLYIVLLAAALAVSVHTPGGHRDWLHYLPPGRTSLPFALVSAIGTMNSVIFIAGLLTADYARFVRPAEIGRASIFVGIGFQVFCFTASGLLGMWFGVLYLDSNPGAYFVTMLGGWGTMFAIATQLRINLANMYSGSMAFVNIIRQLVDLEVSRHLMVLMFGLVVTVALLFDLLSHLTIVLNVIGMFTTCFTCLVLVDLCLIRPLRVDHPPADHDAMPDWRRPAVLSLLVGTGFGSLLQTGLLGPAWVSMAGIAAALLEATLYVLGSLSSAGMRLTRAGT